MKRVFVAAVAFWAASSFAKPGDLVSIKVLKERSEINIFHARRNFCPTVSRIKKLYAYTNYQVRFKTLDVTGNEVLSMGLMMIPKVAGPLPEVVYQHGTLFGRDELPSNAPGLSEGEILGDCIVSLGYVGVLADYLGFGDGTGVHPYLHADSEAWVARDLMRATDKALRKLKIDLNGKRFIAGYSQGGHAAMALHRMLEQDPTQEFIVTASAPMAGPYALTEGLHDIVASPSPNSPAEAAYLAMGMNEVYPIFSDIRTVFKAPYDVLVPELFDGTRTWKEALALLSIPLTNLFQEDFFQTLLNDPKSPMAAAMSANEVYQWVPTAPMTLYHGGADIEVPFKNSQIAHDYMKARGAKVSLVNVGEMIDHGHGFPYCLDAAAVWFETF